MALQEYKLVKISVARTFNVKLLCYQKLALDSVIFLLTELDECSSHVFKLV